ncbi:hypothetical protein THAOC_09533, partial [Thalassiosira oceanica]
RNPSDFENQEVSEKARELVYAMHPSIMGPFHTPGSDFVGALMVVCTSWLIRTGRSISTEKSRILEDGPVRVNDNEAAEGEGDSDLASNIEGTAFFYVGDEEIDVSHSRGDATADEDMAVGWLKDEVRTCLPGLIVDSYNSKRLHVWSPYPRPVSGSDLSRYVELDAENPLAGDERDENGEEAVGRGLRSKAKASKKGNIAINGAWESLEARLEALENKNKILKTNLEALKIIKHEILKTNLEALKTEHALLQRCIEVEEVDDGGATKLHVKSECEFNVHDDHTTHGHHTIKGGNLFMSNGLGSSKCSSSSSVNEDGGDGNDTTIECSGMGNIIVGHQHDDLSAGHRAITGGHNIILGEGHTVTSHGGIVSGVDHVTMWPRALMPLPFQAQVMPYLAQVPLLWEELMALLQEKTQLYLVDSLHSSISGGTLNTARGDSSSVTGGLGNKAPGDASSISGGRANTASGPLSVVSGGIHNAAVGEVSSVSGGNGSTAGGDFSSVSGGLGNTASGEVSSVSGGNGNAASGKDSSVSGGYGNTALGDWSSVSGGMDNAATGDWSSVTCSTSALGVYSSVSGGLSNTASGELSSVLGGQEGTAGSEYSTVPAI